jgi:hypothetical protein
MYDSLHKRFVIVIMVESLDEFKLAIYCLHLLIYRLRVLIGEICRMPISRKGCHLS